VGPIYNYAKKFKYNILVLECLGLVESDSLVIVTHMPITKLGFGLGIMP
jgi:hypothetical protein